MSMPSLQRPAVNLFNALCTRGFFEIQPLTVFTALIHSLFQDTQVFDAFGAGLKSQVSCQAQHRVHAGRNAFRN